MSESLARDDLDRLIRAGYSPREYAGWPHWVRVGTEEVATVGELAGVLLPQDDTRISWVPSRLAAAARLGLGEST